MGEVAIRPIPRGKLPWRLFVQRRLLRGAALEYISLPEDGACIRYTAGLRGRSASFNLPVAPGAAQQMILVTLKSPARAAECTKCRIAVTDEFGRLLNRPGIPAGLVSSSSWPNGDPYWWDRAQLKSFAAAAGLEYTEIVTTSVESGETAGNLEGVFTGPDLDPRNDYRNLLMLLQIPFLIASYAIWRVSPPTSIAFVLLIGLTIILISSEMKTGYLRRWMESDDVAGTSKR